MQRNPGRPPVTYPEWREYLAFAATAAQWEAANRIPPDGRPGVDPNLDIASELSDIRIRLNAHEQVLGKRPRGQRGDGEEEASDPEEDEVEDEWADRILTMRSAKLTTKQKAIKTQLQVGETYLFTRKPPRIC